MKIFVCQSVIRDISREYELYKDDRLETGGIFLGLLIPDRNEMHIVEMVSGGNNAYHGENSFEMDKEYVNQIANEIADSYIPQLELVGLWHTHYDTLALFSKPDMIMNGKFYECVNHPIVSLIVNIVEEKKEEYHLFLIDKKSEGQYVSLETEWENDDYSEIF